MLAMIDIPNEPMKEYLEELKTKKHCKIPPAGRFTINYDGTITYSGLVCDNRMGSKQTGVGASVCNNCKEKDNAS